MRTVLTSVLQTSSLHLPVLTPGKRQGTQHAIEAPSFPVP